MIDGNGNILADTALQIARICHEANRAYCRTIGDDSQPAWDEAPDWQRTSAFNGVLFAMSGDRKPEDSHNSWMAEKIRDGWVYGELKDPAAKTHPCMVSYEELPLAQRMKDKIFLAICNAFMGTT